MARNTMHEATVHHCECPACQEAGDSAVKQLHSQINLFLSRLDEQQRRLYAAIESNKHGHGGDVLLARITGLSVHTISRGRKELQGQLRDRPAGRVRRPGGGRPRVEKKTPPSRRT
jgi:hypothetical protein